MTSFALAFASNVRTARAPSRSKPEAAAEAAVPAAPDASDAGRDGAPRHVAADAPPERRGQRGERQQSDSG